MKILKGCQRRLVHTCHWMLVQDSIRDFVFHFIQGFSKPFDAWNQVTSAVFSASKSHSSLTPHKHTFVFNGIYLVLPQLPTFVIGWLETKTRMLWLHLFYLSLDESILPSGSQTWSLQYHVGLIIWSHGISDHRWHLPWKHKHCLLSVVIQSVSSWPDHSLSHNFRLRIWINAMKKWMLIHIAWW